MTRYAPVNQWVTVTPDNITPGERVRAHRGQQLVQAKVLTNSYHGTSITLDLVPGGIPLYLDEGWIWEASRPVNYIPMPDELPDTAEILEQAEKALAKHRAMLPERGVSEPCASCHGPGNLHWGDCGKKARR